MYRRRHRVRCPSISVYRFCDGHLFSGTHSFALLIYDYYYCIEWMLCVQSCHIINFNILYRMLCAVPRICIIIFIYLLSHYPLVPIDRNLLDYLLLFIWHSRRSPTFCVHNATSGALTRTNRHSTVRPFIRTTPIFPLWNYLFYLHLGAVNMFLIIK